MAQGQNRGGQRRQNDNGGGGNQNRNQELLDPEWLKGKTNALFSLVGKVRRAIEAVLPVHVSYDKFAAIVMTAVRSDPAILQCHPETIVTACLRAAYDGLMPDKREAVLLGSWNSKTGRKEARYQSMVAGLRKQILAGGVVSDVLTTIVYKHEIDSGRFKVVRGTNPSIDHEPLGEAERGEPQAAYAVAFYHDNRRPTFEVMYKGEIETIRDSAQSGDVWKGPYVLEMWRKTVLRRFRKSLPGGNDIIDMEAREMFAGFAEVPGAAALPAPPRPTRQATAARLADQRGMDDGVAMDLGDFAAAREEDENRQMVDRETGEVQQQDRQRSNPDQKSESMQEGPGNGRSGGQDEPKTQQNRESANRRSNDEQKPENRGSDDKKPEKADKKANPADWGVWASEIEADMRKCDSVDQINGLRRSISDLLARAPREIDNRLSDGFQDAIADLMGS